MNLILTKDIFVHNDRVCLRLFTSPKDGGEPYASITVNLVEEALPFDTEEIFYGFVDTNNFPRVEEFIEKFDIGEKTRFLGHSGYCTYPLYRFDKKKIDKLVDSKKELSF